jgi:hypothetical protein
LSTSIGVDRSYDFSAMRIAGSASSLRVSLPGAEMQDAGSGITLPVDRVTVQAPPGMRLLAVSARVSGERRLRVEDWPAGSGEPPVSPIPPSTPDGGWAVATDGGYLRGRRIETIEIRPVQWSPGDRSLLVAGRVHVTLDFAPDGDAPVLARNVRWEPVDAFAAAAARIATVMAERPGSAAPVLAPLVNGGGAFSPRFVPSEDGSPVRFLIITDDALAPAFQRLADWRTALGIPTVVRTTSWIFSNYPRGLDHAEDLRNFIREAVQKWGTEYVLLGGDSDVLPPRYGKSYYYGGEMIPTDLYFQCLDGNWNRNGSDLFGEGYVNTSIPGDGADLYPEVWIGRAPARTQAEAEVFVTKTINYDTLVPTGPGFGDRALLLGEMLFPQNWSAGDTVIFDGAAVCETTAVAMIGSVAPYRMYENYTAYAGAVLESKPAVITRINLGYNLILHVGHGYRNTMAVGLNGEALSNSDADYFYNTSRQGILYAINCTSSAFDFDCISEHFLRNPGGGVAGSIGSTRLDFPETGRHYQDEFFSLLYTQGVTHLGEAAARQKLPFIASSSKDSDHRWTQFSLICMGDPTFDVYTGPVGTLAASVLEPMELGRQSYTVSVTSGGIPVSGATVCLNKTEDAYGYGLTGPDGLATVAFDPDLPGVLSLGVRAHNYLSRVDSLTVTAPSGPHLYAADVVVDDTAGGDGDSRLEAGESAALYLTLGNRGLTDAGAVSVAVLTPPPGVTVIDAGASCPFVPAGGTALCSDPLSVVVETNVPDVSALGMTISLTSGAYSRQEPLALYVGSPNLRLYAAVVRDTTGNGNSNGTLEANEDQHVRFYLRNLGLGRSMGLTAVLSSADPAVQISDATSFYGDLEAGSGHGGDGFLLRFSDASLTHALLLTVSDQRGTVLTRSVNIAPPSAPVSLTASGHASTIDLKWAAAVGGEVGGYNIFRSSSLAGPFARINDLPTDRTAYFRNEELPAMTRFYYKVAAVDSSGNQGPASGVAQATTSLPGAEGFPLDLDVGTPCSPCLAYLSGDTKADLVTGAGEVYAVRDDGTELLDGDNDAQTYGVFAGTGFGPFWAPPAVADLENDGVQDIVAVGFETALLYVWSSHGGARPGWPKSLNPSGSGTPYAWGAPVLADLDGDEDLEILINAGVYTFVFHHDGSEFLDGDHNPATVGVFLVMGATYNYGTPAVGDVDNDGLPEIIVGSRDGKLYVMNPDGTALPGFPYASGGDITNSPAIGDLNNDGWKEIIFANGALKVFAMNANLQQPPGWPQAANMNRDYDASPALADMDGDGYLDVVLCAGNGTVYLWHGQNGQIFPGWGFVLYDAGGAKVGLSSSPAVGNLDADPQYEICFGGNDGNMYAYNVNATPVDGFPISTGNRIEGGPLLWDIDNDGLTEVVAHSLDQHLFVWKSPGAFDPDDQPWPMFHHDSRRTGLVGEPVWVVTAVPGAENPGPPMMLAPGFPNPFSAATTIRFRIPDGGRGEADVDLTIFDALGRRVVTLARGRHASGDYEVSWDGSDAAGRRVGAGVYFSRLRAGHTSVTRKLIALP